MAISVCPSVCHGDKLSKALILHLSHLGLSQFSLRSVSGLWKLYYLLRSTEPKILRLVRIDISH